MYVLLFLALFFLPGVPSLVVYTKLLEYQRDSGVLPLLLRFRKSSYYEAGWRLLYWWRFWVTMQTICAIAMLVYANETRSVR